MYCFQIHVSLPFSSAPQGVEVWQRSVCCSSPPYCLPMLLLGGSPGCFNLSRLYFTLIVLSLQHRKCTLSSPLSWFYSWFFSPLCRLQLFALQWMIKENSVLGKKKHSLTLHLTIHRHLDGAAEYQLFKLFYFADVVCCRRLKDM